ncbi:hypothetical protein Dsin_022116 [Dipteronia sinensis]|uniref:Uncharacterized protein n=1 Tax=Dipteronia sinensis TaxID=43782 RepID=A0AAE0DZM2_9ROSI|nr:hypothetical protein Dsin_022116 [Dipteronia sinensis]
MARSLFLRIVNVVEGHDNYCMQQRDEIGRLSLTAFQKIIVVLRILAYGPPTYAIDEYIKIEESTTIESTKRFCCVLVEVFTKQYLRSPNANDVAKLLRIGKHHGFLSKLGSNNNINVLEASHLFANLAEGIVPPAHYVIQGKKYNMAIEAQMEASTPEVEMVVDENTRFQEFLARYTQIKDIGAYIALRKCIN